MDVAFPGVSAPFRFLLVALIVICAGTTARLAYAQQPLHLVNEQTTVRGVSFRFPETRTFEVDRLSDHVATTAPTFMDRVRRVVPFVRPRSYPFNPVELQRDVVRLERFYNRNGFLHPRVDYPASQLDTTNNTIHVIFTIWEGPPLIVQDFRFVAPDGEYALSSFDEGDEREAWIAFRDRLGLRVGSRYTEFQVTRVQDEILTWLQNRGYAFAIVNYDAEIDSTMNTVDLEFRIDAGPLAHVSEVLVHGNESVSRDVVMRHIPLKEGDRFSQTRLIQGQRNLFGINLFRVAVADVPEQPRDSSVVVRYRMSEARHRHISAQTGYGRNGGVQFQSEWTHRNFLGGGRSLNIALGARTGFLSRPVDVLGETRSFTASASLWQPYLFVSDLSASVTPYYTWQRLLSQEVEFQEIGLSASLIYQLLPFRTIRLEQTISRAFPLGNTQLTVVDPTDVDDEEEIARLEIYDRSILTLAGTFGRADNYVQPSIGYLIRPSLESAGVIFSGVEYVKASVEGTTYIPLKPRYSIAGRLMAGRIWPYGGSRDQADPQVEYRFDRVRFPAGGANDVRGWAPGRLGPETPRANLMRDADGNLILEEPREGESGRRIALSRPGFEPEGGLIKIAGNVELRSRFPGLGPAWQLAAFVDAARIYPSMRQRPSPDLPGEVIGIEEARLRVGTGAGIRYQTPVGYIRLDVGMKVNPSFSDLRDPEDVFRWRYREALRELNPLEPEYGPPEERFWRRFQLHISIGQAF